MKVAQVGTAIVVIHAIAHTLHGFAHAEIPVPLSLLQIWFVSVVILLGPVISAALLWTQFYRIGNWLLLSSMTGAILFGLYHHFIVISPDHVSQVAFTGWGLLFQITAILTLIIDGLGIGMSVWTLKTIQQPQRVM
ncbi:MAG: hypothetical protein DSM106950_00490 [Stigonema ocellatum SAG 48.90 = DSM 106950]|jgi:hypothetical protein|nr:hypothetical protein [Stigonema ocellatum SAG 48.90 = DSM 106950]